MHSHKTIDADEAHRLLGRIRFLNNEIDRLTNEIFDVDPWNMSAATTFNSYEAWANHYAETERRHALVTELSHLRQNLQTEHFNACIALTDVYPQDIWIRFEDHYYLLNGSQGLRWRTVEDHWSLISGHAT